MTPELWERLKPLFGAALEAPKDQRTRLVAEMCGGDSDLRRELIGLLEAHDRHLGTQDEVSLLFEHLPIAKAEYFAPGEMLLGRFRIVRRLGSGGMGDVYQAIDTELSQTIALKAIRADFAGDPAILARFKKEVQLARRISSANVCRIHELFLLSPATHPTASAFLTMEYLEGTVLADWLYQRGPVPLRDARAILLDICAGLMMMHDAGVIHRDLKCRNIMLVEREGVRRAVLMDFGLAREVPVATSTAETVLTRPFTMAGTPEYMAPEQFEGKASGPATDIYAAGVVLYEVATGKHPFAASSPLGAALLRAKRPEPIASLRRDLPRHWDFVIAKCLEYQPERRYPSARELARAIEHRISLRKDILRREEKRPDFKIALLLAACLVFCTLAYWTAKQVKSHRPPSKQAQDWYERGTNQLREGAYVQATRALERRFVDRRDWDFAKSVNMHSF